MSKTKPANIELTEAEQRAVDELCEKRGLTGRDLAVLFLNAVGVYPPEAKTAAKKAS